MTRPVSTLQGLVLRLHTYIRISRRTIPSDRNHEFPHDGHFGGGAPLEAKVDSKADKEQADQIATTLDGLAKRLVDDETERAAITHEQSRHRGWIGQLAENTDNDARRALVDFFGPATELAAPSITTASGQYEQPSAHCTK